MEFEAGRTNFSLSPKKHDSDFDTHRAAIVDPGSQDLVVNGLSEAAASSQFSLPRPDFNEKAGLRDAYTFGNALNNWEMPFPSMSFNSQFKDGYNLPYDSSPGCVDAWQLLQNNMATFQAGLGTNLTTANPPMMEKPQIYPFVSPPMWPLGFSQQGPLASEDMTPLHSGSAFVNNLTFGETAKQTVTSQYPSFGPFPIIPCFTQCDRLDAKGSVHALSKAEDEELPMYSLLPDGRHDFFPQFNEPVPAYQEPGYRSDVCANLVLSQPSFPTLTRSSSSQSQHSPSQEILTVVKLNDRQPEESSQSTPPAQEDLMANFYTRPEPPPSKHVRKTFTKEEKKKVRQVRTNGACLCCRARKVSCSANGVCKTCLRLVSHPSLASHVCVRTKLKDHYIGVRDLHGRSLIRRKANLEPILEFLVGSPMNIQLSVSSEISNQNVGRLNLQVKRCSSSPTCRWKRLEQVDGIYVTSDIVHNERYVIVPTTLPTIDELDTFGRSILLLSDRSHSGAITRLLDRFLAGYCSRGISSRLRLLANLTSRIASLNNLVAYGFLNLHDGSFDLLDRRSSADPDQRFVSETVHDQIRLLASEGLEPAEKLVFAEIDDLIKIASMSKHARIVAGMCLLRLVILYRDRLIRDEIRLKLPKNTNRHQYRLEKAAFMYKRLTVAYATLCREHDSPLTVEWEDEDGFQDTDGSGLDENFQQIYPAFQQFCGEKLCRQHDDIFRDLIVNCSRDHRNKRRRIAEG